MKLTSKQQEILKKFAIGTEVYDAVHFVNNDGSPRVGKVIDHHTNSNGSICIIVKDFRGVNTTYYEDGRLDPHFQPTLTLEPKKMMLVEVEHGTLFQKQDA